MCRLSDLASQTHQLKILISVTVKGTQSWCYLNAYQKIFVTLNTERLTLTYTSNLNLPAVTGEK